MLTVPRGEEPEISDAENAGSANEEDNRNEPDDNQLGDKSGLEVEASRDKRAGHHSPL